jgi:hypothetical protein
VRVSQLIALSEDTADSFIGRVRVDSFIGRVRVDSFIGCVLFLTCEVLVDRDDLRLLEDLDESGVEGINPCRHEEWRVGDRVPIVAR